MFDIYGNQIVGIYDTETIEFLVGLLRKIYDFPILAGHKKTGCFTKKQPDYQILMRSRAAPNNTFLVILDTT